MSSGRNTAQPSAASDLDGNHIKHHVQECKGPLHSMSNNDKMFGRHERAEFWCAEKFI